MFTSEYRIVAGEKVIVDIYLASLTTIRIQDTAVIYIEFCSFYARLVPLCGMRTARYGYSVPR